MLFYPKENEDKINIFYVFFFFSFSFPFPFSRLLFFVISVLTLSPYLLNITRLTNADYKATNNKTSTHILHRLFVIRSCFSINQIKKNWKCLCHSVFSSSQSNQHLQLLLNFNQMKHINKNYE